MISNRTDAGRAAVPTGARLYSCDAPKAECGHRFDLQVVDLLGEATTLGFWFWLEMDAAYATWHRRLVDAVSPEHHGGVVCEEMGSGVWSGRDSNEDRRIGAI